MADQNVFAADIMDRQFSVILPDALRCVPCDGIARKGLSRLRAIPLKVAGLPLFSGVAEAT